MVRTPRIGVTGNHRRWAPAWWCTSLALRLSGAQPQRISIHHPWDGPLPDALVIGGGNDVSPEHYGGEVDAKVKLDPERDKLEMHWIETALEKGIPMVGICRGAQLINVMLGGTLHSDIRHIRRLTYNRPGLLPTKQVWLEPDSLMARIAGKTKLRVNSLHHQAVDQPGRALQRSGRDLDHITQAIEATDERPIIGVQWHPEYMAYLPAQLRIFRWLVARARDRVQAR